MAEDVAEEYLSSLTDLTVNSKPLINMLTMLAEENSDHAPSIVQAIESHIEKVSADVKLPVLYLIDSIVKNVSAVYVPLFTNNIVQIFASVFEKVDEKTRMSMFKLRQTWNDIFPAKKMYTLDLRIQHMDQNWPTLSPPPTSIHVNPKFLNKTAPKTAAPAVQTTATAVPNDLDATLVKKQKILLELQQKKRELELIQQKVMFGDQVPQAIVRPVLNEDASKAASLRGMSVPKSTPRAVVMPPAPVQNNPQQSVVKTKIAPVNSILIEAAKSRDPRLARMQTAQKSTDSSKEVDERGSSHTRRGRKSPQRTTETETDLLDDLLKQQRSQSARLTQMATRHVEKKLPDVKVAEDLIQQRQMAMLKAPVLGQLNHKSEAEKTRRRRISPLRRDPRSRRSQRESPKPEDKDSPTRNKHYKDNKSRRKVREKPSRNSTKSEENKPDRKRERREKFERRNERVREEKELRLVEPAFSPPPPENGSTSTMDHSPGDLEMVISSPSPEAPPPPTISPEIEEMELDDARVEKALSPPPEPMGFKTVKNALKSRNYSRRNKERSLTPPVDVDLRVNSAETNADDQLTSQTSKTAEDLVDVGKDVDLRLFAVSSPKKRLSTDGNLDGPPNKRGKSEVDAIQLFGNKDMDERMPPRGLRTPPPPPMIATTPPMASPSDHIEQDESNHSLTTWADLKPRPEAEVKPMMLSQQLELQVTEMERDDLRRQAPPASPQAGERDRLGRPLLYTRLPNDPRARRESLHNHDDHNARSNDFFESQEDLHVDDILVQAKEQLSRGTMSLHQYNELMAQIVRMNEDQKIRDAKRQRRPFRGAGGASPSFDGPPRSNFSGPQNFRGKEPWRTRSDEEGPPFAGRYRGGPGGNMGHRSRMNNSRWNEGRFTQGGHSPDWNDQDSRSQEPWAPGVDLPPTDPSVLDVIACDTVRHISIDGTPRAIRFYGDMAVVMLSFSSARMISFENGLRHVFIAGLEIPCQLNGPVMPFLFQKNTHRVRLGAPTRELYVDDRFYEVHFGGPPVQAELAGVPCTVQLEGPPPQVRIAPNGNDLCLGSVLLIVDARSSFTIYLDAKPQRFEINGRPLVLKFINKLTTVLINDVSVPLKFGGCPVPVNFADGQHFLRLTELPPEVVAGKVFIRGMDSSVGDSPLHNQDSNSREVLNPEPMEPKIEPIEPAADLDRGMYMDLVSTMMGGVSEDDKKVGFNYQVESENKPAISLPSTIAVPPIPGPPTSVLPILPNLNINDLFKSLVATGIIAKQPEPVVKADLPSIKHVDFDDPASLRERQPGVISRLYSGIQCGSCGVRFPPEETTKYSQHLDWHFRQNRRDRDAARRGSSRRWYYDVSDWIQFEEIEDLEERAQSWFETEAQGQGEETTEEEELRSVPAPPGGLSVLCHVCHDRFDTFFHEDTEEWHLKNCVMIDEKYYHPACYQDSVKIPDELLAVEQIEISEPIMAPPLLEPLKVEEPERMEESIVVLEDDEKDDDGEVEVVTADEEAIQILVEDLMDRVVMEEECEKSPIEDDELEVLAVTNKDNNKPPIDVIDVPETADDEVYRPTSPAIFDPNRKIKQEPVDEMESPLAQVDQTLSSVTASIDGNVEMAEAPVAPASTASKIKITFTKPLPVAEPVSKVIVDTDVDPTELQIEEIDPDPLPLKPKKPRIAEAKMTEYPPLVKGNEISGLCSIM